MSWKTYAVALVVFNLALGLMVRLIAALALEILR